MRNLVKKIVIKLLIKNFNGIMIKNLAKIQKYGIIILSTYKNSKKGEEICLSQKKKCLVRNRC